MAVCLYHLLLAFGGGRTGMERRSRSSWRRFPDLPGRLLLFRILWMTADVIV